MKNFVKWIPFISLGMTAVAAVFTVLSCIENKKASKESEKASKKAQEYWDDQKKNAATNAMNIGYGMKICEERIKEGKIKV